MLILEKIQKETEHVIRQTATGLLSYSQIFHKLCPTSTFQIRNKYLCTIKKQLGCPWPYNQHIQAELIVPTKAPRRLKFI